MNPESINDPVLASILSSEVEKKRRRQKWRFHHVGEQTHVHRAHRKRLTKKVPIFYAELMSQPTAGSRRDFPPLKTANPIIAAIRHQLRMKQQKRDAQFPLTSEDA